MKDSIENLLTESLRIMVDSGALPLDALSVVVRVERSKEPAHGDYATNLPLILAKMCRQSPLPIAQKLVENLPRHAAVFSTEVAAAGFINFFIHQSVHYQVIETILKQKDEFGKSNKGDGHTIALEFAYTPSEPLHVEQGKNAATGASLGAVLSEGCGILQSHDRPLYSIQYAHARISSVLRQLDSRGFVYDEAMGMSHLERLTDPHEVLLIKLVGRFPETCTKASQLCEPQQIAYYLHELATGLHSYYNAVTLLCEIEAVRHARLCLLKAVRQILYNGLQLMGVFAPESM